MAALWIVHRDAEVRRGLRRLAGERTLVEGSPGDVRFEDAERPSRVVLGASGDFELELEFAHRFAERASEATWIVLAGSEDVPEARRLFQGLAAEVIPYPAGAAELRRRLRRPPTARSVASLAERRLRDRLAARFALWFADLDLPELLRALDPKLADVPLRVWGEPGCGRLLLARYVHLFATYPAGPFVVLPCGPSDRATELLEALQRHLRTLGCVPGVTGVCLDGLDRLGPGEQRELAGWIELGLPIPRSAGEETAAARRIRWMATLNALGETGSLDPTLAGALAGVDVRIPPLRERSQAIVPFVEATLERWCREHGEKTRELDPEAIASLLEHPWPGNLRELEAVLIRSLAADSSDPLPAAHLLLEEGDALPGEASAEPAFPDDLDALEGIEPLETDAAPPSAEPASSFEAETERDPTRPPLFAEQDEEELAVEAEAPVSSDPALQGLASALAREMRDPLEQLRRLAEMAPAHGEEPAFRDRLLEALDDDSERLDGLRERLSHFGRLGSPEPERVDLAELLDELLERYRATIERRRLLVLKELDRDQPLAWVDPAQIRFGFDALLAGVIERVPDRGDLYLSSKSHPEAQADARAWLRVLLRFHNPPDPVRAESDMVELAMAAAIVRSQGGSAAVDRGAGDETLILFELPAP